MYLEPVISSLLVGKLRKGSFKNLLLIELKGWYLFVAAALTQTISNILYTKGSGVISDFLVSNFLYVHILTYLFIFIGIIMNFPKKSMILLLIGSLLNFAVITANQGTMPVQMDEYSKVHFGEMDIRHSLVTDETKLYYLADIIPIPRPYPLPQILSIGDIFIMLGVFMFIQELMVTKVKSSIAL